MHSVDARFGMRTSIWAVSGEARALTLLSLAELPVCECLRAERHGDCSHDPGHGCVWESLPRRPTVVCSLCSLAHLNPCILSAPPSSPLSQGLLTLCMGTPDAGPDSTVFMGSCFAGRLFDAWECSSARLLLQHGLLEKRYKAFHTAGSHSPLKAQPESPFTRHVRRTMISMRQ